MIDPKVPAHDCALERIGRSEAAPDSSIRIRAYVTPDIRILHGLMGTKIDLGFLLYNYKYMGFISLSLSMFTSFFTKKEGIPLENYP